MHRLFCYTGAEGLVLACGLGLVAALTETPKARQARFGEPRRQPPARHSLPRRFKSFPFMPEGEKQKAIANAMTFHFPQGRKDLRTQARARFRFPFVSLLARAQRKIGFAAFRGVPCRVILSGITKNRCKCIGFFVTQGRKDLNPRHAVLETAVLPTELHPYLFGTGDIIPYYF